MIDISLLNRHGAVFGSTGSGKTGVLIHLIEQAREKDVRVIVVDPKGDLSCLKDSLGMEVYFPSTRYNPIAILRPIQQWSSAPEESARVLAAYLDVSEKVKYFWERFLTSFPANEELIPWSFMLNHSPDVVFEGLPLSELIPKRELAKVIERLKTFFRVEYFDLVIGSQIDDILNSRQSFVLNSAFIPEEHRMTFLSYFLQKYKEHIFRNFINQKGLANLLVIDEFDLYAPPYPRCPPTKQIFEDLFRRSRSFGSGVLIATQNMVDIDYRLLNNALTWVVGIVRTTQDRIRVTEAIHSAVGIRVHELPKESRQFLVVQENKQKEHRSPDVKTVIRSYDPADLYVPVATMVNRFFALTSEATQYEFIEQLKVIAQELYSVHAQDIAKDINDKIEVCENELIEIEDRLKLLYTDNNAKLGQHLFSAISGVFSMASGKMPTSLLGSISREGGRHKNQTKIDRLEKRKQEKLKVLEQLEEAKAAKINEFGAMIRLNTMQIDYI